MQQFEVVAAQPPIRGEVKPKDLTPRILRRVHLARVTGTPMREIARELNIGYKALGKAMEKWRNENGIAKSDEFAS